jgi:hypothetical protein
MPIKIPCACGARLNVPDNLAGKRVRCPQCKNVHAVPDASAFQQVPGTKRVDDDAPAKPAEESPKKAISLKGKGDAAKHSGRLSEPTMVMSTDALKEILEGKAVEEKPDEPPAEEPPPPEPEPPAPEPPAEDDEDRIPAPEPQPERETRVRRVEAKEHLKKIKQELKEQKDGAGTRYIPASSGLAKTRGAEPTMVITKDQIRQLQEAEEVADDEKPPQDEAPPAPEQPADEQPFQEMAEEKPEEAPPPAVELPPVEKPKSDIKQTPLKPKSDIKQTPLRPKSDVAAPPAACGHSSLMLLAVAGFCFLSAGASLLAVLGWLGRIPAYATLTLTGLAGILAIAQAMKK